MPLSWKDELSVGIEEIDIQHKSIIKMINQLEECITNRDVDGINSVLNDSVNYVSSHFAVEETLMSIFNYTDFSEHKMQHKNFAYNVQKKKKRLESYLNSDAKASEELIIEIAKDLHQMLEKWLVTHILHTDKDYSEFFLKIKEKAAHKGGWLTWFGLS